MMGAVRHFTPVLVLAALLLLVGCTGGSSTPDPASSSLAPTTGPSPTATPDPDPELIPAGSADDNLPYFDFVNAALLADGNPGGQAVIDNLVAAGFDKSAMQLMADKTPHGAAVDSLQFSVQLADECLIGQIGGSGYASTVGPALQSGGCLVGKTRPIDW